MKKFLLASLPAILLTVFALGAFRAGSPAPSVYAVPLEDTLAGIRSALTGQPGTTIFASDKLVVFSWKYAAGDAFIVMEKFGNPMWDLVKANGNGQRVSSETMKELARLFSTGVWRKVSPSELPKEIIETMLTSAQSLMIRGYKNLVTPLIIILPVVPNFENFFFSVSNT